MNRPRVIAFAAIGWAVPDIARGRWATACLALGVACVAFIAMLWHQGDHHAD